MKLRNNNAILLVVIILIYPCSVYAERDNILLNLQAGYHYDAGNLRSLRTSGVRPQKSLFAGLSYKADLSFFFFQLGLNRSLLLSRGTIYNDSADELQSVTVHYYSAPIYCGLNFPVMDHSKLFIGAGILYFLLDGTVKTEHGSVSFNEIMFARVITAGVQHRFSKYLGLILQWENINASSAPVADIDSTNNWKNFDIDMTGNRFSLGITYYVK